MMLALPPSTGVYSFLYDFGLVSYTEGVRKFFNEPECPKGEAIEHFRMIIIDETNDYPTATMLEEILK